MVWGSTADLAARMSLKAREEAERAGAIGTVHADAAHGTDVGVRRPSYIAERFSVATDRVTPVRSR
ncbi:hypothetical protein AN221_20530 [Streptomyces nanshensis]|uniref:Uncharacterized protein n=1 Tax=Streptomyces nanshensis TaxID=518642 RepID=A0A1E7LRL0_9ACTN|nr:hypothetical protein AN221_20530 [Streptomyces nanshensis]